MNDNKNAKQRNIFYKFFVSTKEIPWLLGGENIFPLPDIQDSYFDFVEMISNQFYFVTPFLARIVTDYDNYKYWKVERYHNNVKDKTFYFYTSRTSKYLKNGFELEMSLDIYMTYSKDIINWLKDTNVPVKVNRTSITYDMMTKPNDDFRNLVKGLRNVDENVLGGDDAFINRPLSFQLETCEKDNPEVDLNHIPIRNNKFLFHGNEWGYFNNPRMTKNDDYTPAPGTVSEDDLMWVTTRNMPSGVNSYRSVQFENEIKYTDKRIYANTVPFEKHPDPYPEQKEINDFIGSMCYIKKFRLDELTTVQRDDINRNISNSYFMVFRTVDGHYDCFPIFGKIPVEYQVPSVCMGSDDLTRFTWPTDSTYDKVQTKPMLNRVYSTNETVFSGYLDNDFESIYNDYVKKNVVWYPGSDSYLGIYRGVIPMGTQSKVHFVIKSKNDLPTYSRIVTANKIIYRYAVPHRMCYRIKYTDFIHFNIRNPRRASGYFELVSANKANLIDNYIELLQPISIGTTEIIPARYCFLAKYITNKNLTGFTLPLSMSFMEGFKLFLNTINYNNSSYSINLGNTLPTNSAKYYRQLEQIEINKNASISASIGNLIARPINWLSGGLSLNKFNGFNDSFTNTLFTAKRNEFDFWKYLNEIEEGGERRGYSSSSGMNRGGSGSFNVSGIGGFIGDFINIGNTIKTSNFLKKNVGPGYMTSTEEDLMNAVTHSSFNTVGSELADTLPGHLQNGKLTTNTCLKTFTDATKSKYKWYFQNFGFAVGDFLRSGFINSVIQHCKNFDETVFISLDKDWCLMNLSRLAQYSDNVVKSSIINQLANGIRMKNFQ